MDRLRERMEQLVPVSDTLWEEIVSRSKKVKLKTGEVLVPFGSVNRFSYFLLSGSCVCSQASKSGKTRVIWFYFHDLFEFFGTPDSLFNGEPTKYELRAFTNCEIIKIHRSSIDELVAADKNFNDFFIRRILFDYITVFEARSYLLTYTSSEFLEYISDKYPLIIERIPAKYIADFIGVTPEWYSKLKKELNSNKS
ncbi:MAG: Crp/Fnr family transcriptional regulator [Bacteroidota bacterium]